MPINEQKDTRYMAAKTQIFAGNDRHFFDVYLWDDMYSMRTNADGCCERTCAVVNHEGDFLRIGEDGGIEQTQTGLFLGEIHFARNRWNTEIVAHELTHALLGRFRKLPPDPIDVIEQVDDHEEAICYEFGKWFDRVYRFLWEHDPADRWRKA